MKENRLPTKREGDISGMSYVGELQIIYKMDVEVDEHVLNMEWEK